MNDAGDSATRGVGVDFLRMLSFVHEQVVLASEALLEGRIEHVAQVRALDRLVDALQDTLEERCLRVLSEEPRADATFLMAVFRSLSDLERAGDYAVHVAEAARVLVVNPPMRRYTDLRRIISTIKTMLAMTARALTERDAETASTATALDSAIDEQHDQFYRELVTYLREHPGAVTEGLALLRVGRSLQRIGDHVENVSERIAKWLDATATRQP